MLRSSQTCIFEVNHFGFMQKRVIHENQSSLIVERAESESAILFDHILNPELKYR